MKAFKYIISTQALITYYFNLVLFCHLLSMVTYFLTKALSDMIEEIQLEAARTATEAE